MVLIYIDGMELMFIGFGFISVTLVVILYLCINAQRDAQAHYNEKEGHGYSPDELREMGDRAPDFRYML